MLKKSKEQVELLIMLEILYVVTFGLIDCLVGSNLIDFYLPVIFQHKVGEVLI